MSIKLVEGEEVLNVICVYALQVGLANDIKMVFWEELEEVMRSILQNEKLCLGEILMVILVKRLMGMIGCMAILALEKETVEGWQPLLSCCPSLF